MGLDTEITRNVIPAKAGIQFSTLLLKAGLTAWILASARMTTLAADVQCVSLNVSSTSVGPRTNYNPRISGDGRFVVFESREQAIAAHRTKFRDIFFFDRNKDELDQIDSPLQRSNTTPSISERGRYIAYQSYPLSVVMGEPPLTADIFVYDRYLNKSAVQTFGRGDSVLDGENCDPRFSGDGRYLVFTSNATIYPGLKNGITRQVYLYDHESRDLELISGADEPGNRPSGDPRVSFNGRYVAFKSAATNLTHLLPLDSIGTHLYLLDRKQKSMIQIDEVSRGFDAEHRTIGRYDMDNNGNIFAFEGRLRDTQNPMEVLNHSNLYIFDRSTGSVTLLTTDIFNERAHSPTLSGDGRFLAFVFRGISKGNKVPDGLIVYDRRDERWTKVVDGSLANPVFSKNGQYIAFESDQADLVPGVSGKVLNVYVVKNPYFE